MRKLFLLASMIALCVPITYAQEKSKPELFAGYSYKNIDSRIKNRDLGGTDIPGTNLEDRFHSNGFNISGTGYLTKRFGITGDFYAAFEDRIDSFGGVQTNTKLSLFNIKGGPQVKFFSARRVTPLLHALFGVSRRKLKAEVVSGSATSITSATDSATSFTMNPGGGLDVRLSERFDFRLIQVDYDPVFLKDRAVSGINFPGRTTNGARISIGLVIK
jgi:hypothetical protein